MATEKQNPESEAAAGEDEEDIEHFELVIELCEKFLSDKINLESTILLDLLKDDEIFTQFDRETVASIPESQQATDEARVKKLLQILKKKDKKAYKSFVEKLKNTGQEHIIDKLRTAIQHAIETVQKKLSDYFQDSYTNVDMLCFHDEGHRVRLDSIYVPIKTITYIKTAAGDKKSCELKHYSEIFLQQDQSVRKLLVRGMPMSGKTTFLRKVAFDWTKTLESPHSTENQWLQQFTIVIPIILRPIRKHSSLWQVIRTQMIFLEDHQHILTWIFSHKAKQVLYILDGLDEFNAAMCPEIISMLQGVLYKESLIVVTSRNEGVTKLNEFSISLHVGAELVGFGYTEIIDYIRRSLKDLNEDDVYRLIEIILSQDEKGNYVNQHLYIMATNPGQLGVLCLMWRQQLKRREKQKQLEENTEKKEDISNSKEEMLELIESRQNLIKQFIEVLIKLSHKRARQPLPKGDIFISCKTKLLQFGKLAMMREDQNMVTVFRWDEVEQYVGNDALDWGLLFKSHPLSTHQESEFSFVHKMVQEFMASFYLTNHTILKTDTLCYSSFDALREDTSLHSFIQYMEPSTMAQISRRSSEVIKASFNQIEKDTNKQVLALLTWVQEAGIPISVIDYIMGTCFANEVDHLHFNNSNMNQQGLAISSLLKCLPRCTELHLINCDLDKDDLANIEQGLGKHKTQVETLAVSYNNLNGAGQFVGKILCLMPHIRQLDMQSCKLNAEDLKEMYHCCKNVKSEEAEEPIRSSAQLNSAKPTERLLLHLVEQGIKYLFTRPTCTKKATAKELGMQLDMSNNNFHGAGSTIGHMLVEIGQLNGLQLRDCGLTASDVTEIEEAIGHTKTEVKNINLNENNLKGAGVSIGCMLKSMPECEQLKVVNCKFTAEDIGKLENQLHNTVTRIQELWLSENNLHGAGGELGKLLQHVPCVKQLKLWECGLIATDMQQLLDKLQSTLKQIDTLDLGLNNLHGAGNTIGQLLLKMPRCSELELYRCKLDSEDLTDMKNTLQDQLIQVSKLTWNYNNLNGAGTVLGELLLLMPKCKKLKLAQCGLVATDIQQMEEALRVTETQIEELILYRNTGLEEAEDAVNSLLKKMPLCKRCDIGVTYLIETDIKIANESSSKY